MELNQLCYPALALACTALLAACGGGNESTAQNPGPEAPAPAITKLTQQQCEAVAAYQWLDHRCHLTGNPHVNNLAYIEALDDAHRERVLAWLLAIEKHDNLDALFPGENTTSKTTKKETKNEASFIDAHLLLQKTGGKSYIKHHDQYLLFDAIRLDSESTLHEVEYPAVADSGHEAVIRAKTTLDNGQFQFWLHDALIYETTAIRQLELTAHIGKTLHQATTHPLAYNSEYDAFRAYDNATIDGKLFTSIASHSIATDEVSLAVAATQLQLAGSRRLSVSVPHSSNTKVHIGDHSSPWFNPKYRTVYLDKSSLLPFFKDNVGTVTLVSQLWANNAANMDIGASRDLFQIRNTVQLTTTFDSDSGVVPVVGASDWTYQQQTHVDRIAQLDKHDDFAAIKAALSAQTENRLAAMYNSAEYGQLALRPNRTHAYPNLDELIGVFSHLDRHVVIAHFIDPDNSPNRWIPMLNGSIPFYRNRIPSPDDIHLMRQWPQQLTDAMTLMLQQVPAPDTSKNRYLEELAKWHLSDSFYLDMLSELNVLFSDLSQETLALYGPSLLQLVVQYAYHDRLSELQSGANIGILAKNAIMAGGTEHAEIIKPAIAGVSNLHYNPDGPSWEVPTAALDTLRTVAGQLTGNHKALMNVHHALTP